MRKIVAKQIPWEDQDSGFDFNTYQDNVVFYSSNNRWFDSDDDRFDSVVCALEEGFFEEDFKEEIEIMKGNLNYSCDSMFELLDNYFYDFKADIYYDLKENLKLIEQAIKYYDDKKYEKAYCLMMTALFGGKWDYYGIHGCSQSDWQTIYVDVSKFNDKNISDVRHEIETLYFNTGTEWEIKLYEDGELIEEDRYYCITYDYENAIKKWCLEVYEMIIDEYVFNNFLEYRTVPIWAKED